MQRRVAVRWRVPPLFCNIKAARDFAPRVYEARDRKLKEATMRFGRWQIAAGEKFRGSVTGKLAAALSPLRRGIKCAVLNDPKVERSTDRGIRGWLQEIRRKMPKLRARLNFARSHVPPR